MKLRLGYKASAEQFAPRELLDYGIAAEKAGFDSVVISDHFQPWKHTDGHAPFSFAWLAALGERTSRVTLGTSVVTPTFRYNPAIVAQAMATLGCLYPGRVFLGVGTGESMNEVPVLDIEWPEPPERFARLKEAIALIRQLWTEDFVTFQGEYYRTRNATVYDRPEEPVRLYVAASGPAAARLAGRVGDGFICTSGKGAELYRDKLLPAVREGAEKEGRDYDSIEKTIEMKVSFDPDSDRALEDCREWAALALPGEKKTGVEDPREMERLADELSAEQAASRWIVSDDPEEHTDRVCEYIDMGFSHLVFHAPGPDQQRFIELYGEKILPRLRERYP
ncbi:MAG TPA: glucose-6-phosphate dehydrogenase (coenzyme-F420) [Candidatus Limnocylindrales bacterium]|nr:glucose-6-phosphate dehydrogenase (coenzyme-F420) [Candidatus Limnocylindrales bacterium]